jgi:hypothetical protein
MALCELAAGETFGQSHSIRLEPRLGGCFYSTLHCKRRYGLSPFDKDCHVTVTRHVGNARDGITIYLRTDDVFCAAKSLWAGEG